MNLERLFDYVWRVILELLKVPADNSTGLRRSAFAPFDSADDVAVC